MCNINVQIIKTKINVIISTCTIKYLISFNLVSTETWLSSMVVYIVISQKLNSCVNFLYRYY